MEREVVLVTGAAKGIGKGIALAYAKAGYDVCINYRGSYDAALATQRECEAFGVQARLYQCDVSHYEAVQKMVDEIVATFGKIDVLVNNAGITNDKLMLRMEEADFDHVIDANLKGTFNVSKFVSKQMLRRKSGKIVNITSVVGVSGNVGQANYAASKAGIVGLTKSMAKEFGSRGILVNAIAPGFIISDMTEQLSEAIQASIKTQIPLQRLGAVEDVASLALFLGSKENRYITSQVIKIDGGMML
ncbi:MAG: 3-oxoacyl-[acyl-carrier-protein] reductase [Erysipelotrichaceae bacterium]